MLYIIYNKNIIKMAKKIKSKSSLNYYGIHKNKSPKKAKYNKLSKQQIQITIELIDCFSKESDRIRNKILTII